MEQSDATICIPAYGVPSLTDNCLVAVMTTCGPAGVIVWDNGVEFNNLLEGAEPEETRLLEQYFARTEAGRTLTAGVWNVGYAEANNRMAAEATSDLLVFLNCDTQVQPGWLEALVRAFDEPDVGVAGPRILDMDGEFRSAGVRVTLGGGIAWAKDVTEDLPSRDVPAVSGACLAIRRELFEEIGGFDAEYFNCFEDVDVCLQVLQAGHRVRYVRESRVRHAMEATGAERFTRAYQQVKRFADKWADSPVAQQALPDGSLALPLGKVRPGVSR